MAVLKRILLGLAILLTWINNGRTDNTSLYVGPQPLHDYVFNGYSQGRATGLLWLPDFAPGDLSTAPPAEQAGGEKSSMLSLSRVHFSLSTPLPWLQDFSLFVGSNIDGSHAIIEDAYARWRPDPEIVFQLGLMRIPFGLDLQTSSSEMDTVEHPLIFDFGNFGWVKKIGMGLAASRALGLRFDQTWEHAWWAITPFVQSGIFSGNGQNTLASTPMQAILRTGISWKKTTRPLRQDDAHHYNLAWGLSGAYGRNKFDTRHWEYIPIGINGNLQTAPESVIGLDHWERYENTATWGSDIRLTLSDLTCKYEWVARRFSSWTSQGYYLTLIYHLDRITSQDLEWVIRWEDACQGYADGAHIPGKPYQATTLGLNWRPDTGSPILDWRIQLHYITLYFDYTPHLFHGSDLLIGQIQVSF